MIGVSAPALAQTAGSAAPPVEVAQAATPAGIADIVVTARRRQERLQDVPVAITALNPETLRQQNVETAQDLQGKVPSLAVNAAGQTRKSEIFEIRGVGATLGAGPAVVTYFAEVPLPQDAVTSAQGGGSGMFYDLQNVQVLKGPQGTLFGRNTTGGAVLIEPRRPTASTGGYLEGTYGNYNDVEIEGALNIPVVEDKLLVRVAGRYQNRDGFTRDVVTGKDYDNKNYYTGRIGITFRPTELIDNYLMAYYYNADDNGTGTVIGAFNDKGPTAAYNSIFGAGFLQGIVAEQKARGPRRTQLSADPFDRLISYGVTDQLSIKLSDDLTLRNIASYARLKHAFRLDGDGSKLAITETITPAGNWMTNGQSITEELQLQGNQDNGRFVWVVGGYFQDDKPVGEQRTYGASFVFPGIDRPSAYTLNISGEKRYSRAIYAQGTLDFGTFSDALAGLKFTAGGRFTWDRKKFFSNFFDLSPAGACIALPGQFVPNCERRPSFTYKEPTYTFSLDYRFSRDVLGYVKFARGYKAGGFTDRAVNPLFQSFKPEFVNSYEAGVKTDFRLAGMPVRFNADYYYSDYQNLQKTGGAIYLGKVGAASYNVGNARIQGVEVETTIEPTRHLRLSGSYSYLDAKYVKFDLPTGTGTTIDLSGNPFQFAPKNIYSATATYTVPLPRDSEVVLGATYSYTGKQFTSPVDSPAVEPFAYDRAFGLLSLSLDWNSVAGSKFDLSAFCTNATNKLYTISAYPVYGSIGFTSYIYGEPRMYGVRLRYRFGAQ